MEVFTGSCLFGLFTVDVIFSRVINFARKSLFAWIYFPAVHSFERNRPICAMRA